MSILEKVYSKRSNQNPIQRNWHLILPTLRFFQNVRNSLRELHTFLTPDQEHKKVFQDIPVVGCRNSKSLKDHLVREKLPNVKYH